MSLSDTGFLLNDCLRRTDTIKFEYYDFDGKPMIQATVTYLLGQDTDWATKPEIETFKRSKLEYLVEAIHDSL